MTRLATWWEGLKPQHRRAIRDGAIVSGIIFNLVVIFAWGSRLLLWGDAQSWYTIDLNDLYGRAEVSLLETGAFRLAPVIAWVMYPFTKVPWELWVAGYVVVSLVAVAIVGQRWTPILVLAFPPIFLELINGNIHLFMALAIWAGMRWPAAWSFILLTKVTPGVGVLWFAFRREWRNLAVALGATAAIVAVGFAINPQQWQDWIHSLVVSANGPQVGTLPPLLLRLPVAAAIVWYAAWSNRAWVVPFACVLAMPTIWIQSSALLLASIALYRDRAWFEKKSPALPSYASDAHGPQGVRASEMARPAELARPAEMTRPADLTEVTTA
jgi:Glycosyltransferase family 87